MKRAYIIARHRELPFTGTEETILRKNGKFKKRFGFLMKFESCEDAKEIATNLIHYSNVHYEIRRVR